MCGIAGIINKSGRSRNLRQPVIAMSQALSHRGPDGEGFIIASEHDVLPLFQVPLKNGGRDLPYLPQHSIQSAAEGFLAFAHRRLSIIDLSEAGHQPMCDMEKTVWLTFNGEIYNYIELRKELQQLGHNFISECDTEVVLQAYKQWGYSCVEKFNGMWAFCLYDTAKKICFASRDRLGVKPFYYVDNDLYFAFASEQKAFIKAGICDASINEKELHNYLVNTSLETSTDNFFSHIKELWPGYNLVYDIKSSQVKVHQYFHLRDIVSFHNDDVSEPQLIENIRLVFENAVRLRMRSDVEVGTCLSGGIDSSALAVTMASHTTGMLNCFTSVFPGRKINEEKFADLAATAAGAKHFKIEASPEGFMEEVDQLVYSQDVPIWDTSTYAQFKVMELAANNKIKVVLDGQGADELFAGYHHHFIAKWNNLLSQGKIGPLVSDIITSETTIPAPFVFYLKQRIKAAYNFSGKQYSAVFNSDFLNSGKIRNKDRYASSVNDQLISDIYETRLKSFLKCEDRCGMWHSVESRTPFSDDIELMKLMFSFNGNKKIKNGISKYLLREAVKTRLPAEIYSRYDKQGFETPMQEWMQSLRPQLVSSVNNAGFNFLKKGAIDKLHPKNDSHNKILFRLFILSRWMQVFQR